MKNITLITSLALILLTSSCKWFQREELSGPAEKPAQVPAVIVQDSAFRQLVRNEHMVLATLYQQTAAEYRALCYYPAGLPRWLCEAKLHPNPSIPALEYPIAKWCRILIAENDPS